MMNETMAQIAKNPFATCFTKPGKIPFLFPDGSSMESLFQQLRINRNFGQIRGPHGSGKSTLLWNVAKVLHGLGFNVLHKRLQRQSASPLKFHCHVEHLNQRITVQHVHSTGGSDFLLLDGFEQLPAIQRKLIVSWSKRHAHGLIVTTHNNAGLPTVFETRSHIGTLRKIVHYLLPSPDDLTDECLIKCFENSGCNIRESLFSLFDVFQPRVGRKNLL
jgi:hypothetical protein